ncbi:MAG: acyltransferase [Treponema sp.]|jgi:hypothetical protein|nr:acyltransferase [Treponema sp.]
MKQYTRPVTRASPDIQTKGDAGFEKNKRISKAVRFILHALGRPYLSLFIGKARIELENGDRLFSAFERALSKKSRLILAFSHPYGQEPQILMWFTLFRLKQAAKKGGFSFALPPLLRFVHGYEVLRWGGLAARLVLPCIGGLTVYHAKVNSSSMERIYRALIDGPFPIAIAPEGLVSYFSRTVPSLEQGAVRIGFIAAKRLSAGGIQGKGDGDIPPIEILPLGIRYEFDEKGRRSMMRLLEKTEECLGLQNSGEELGKRLEKCLNFLLEKNEEWYELMHEGSLEERVNRLMETALERAEQILGVKHRDGKRTARFHRLRQIYWDRIYLPGKTSLKAFTRLERAIVDRKAGEAWYADRHLEMVDFVWCLPSVPIPTEASPLHEQVDYTQNLWDFANRTMGGILGDRVNIPPCRVVLTPSNSINLSDSLPAYKADKRATIQAVMDRLSAELLTVYSEDKEA